MKTFKLDWELASNLSRHEDELLAWESEAFEQEARADLIIGADIVSFSSHLLNATSSLIRSRAGL